MGCGTSRPREMQVIHHAPWPWYGGRVAPDLETDNSFEEPLINHSSNWWFSNQLDLEESYASHHVRVPRGNSLEPPPYTEVAQNGHISLMRGYSPIRAAENSQGIDSVNMDSSTLTTNNISVLEESENLGLDAHNQSSSNGVDTEHSQNSSSEEPLRCPQSPFHPTRQSTPVLERRQLPPLQRSRSASDANALISSSSDVPLHRHSIQGVPLALPSSLPPRLTPLSPPFDYGPEEHGTQPSETTDNLHNVGPFPVRPGRLPPIQQFNVDQQQQEQRRLSGSFDGQIHTQRRVKKKRKRTRSWHGERIGSDIIAPNQEVSTLSTVAE